MVGTFSTRVEAQNELDSLFHIYLCDKKFDLTKMFAQFRDVMKVGAEGFVLYHPHLRVCMRFKLLLLTHLADMIARQSLLGLFSLTLSNRTVHFHNRTWRHPLAHDPTGAVHVATNVDLISNREARAKAALPGDRRRANAARDYALLSKKERKKADEELATKARAVAAAEKKAGTQVSLLKQLIKLNM